METTNEILVALYKTLCDQYAEQLAALPMKKATRDTLIDGFKDGARMGIRHAVQMLGVEIK
jgi:hypothetical protein